MLHCCGLAEDYFVYIFSFCRLPTCQHCRVWTASSLVSRPRPPLRPLLPCLALIPLLRGKTKAPVARHDFDFAVFLWLYRTMRSPSCDFPSELLTPTRPAALPALATTSSAPSLVQPSHMPPTIHLPETGGAKVVDEHKPGNWCRFIPIFWCSISLSYFFYTPSGLSLEKIISDTVMSPTNEQFPAQQQQQQQQQLHPPAALSQPPQEKAPAQQQQQASLVIQGGPGDNSTTQHQTTALVRMLPPGGASEGGSSIQGRLTANVALPDGSVIQVLVVSIDR